MSNFLLKLKRMVSDPVIRFSYLSKLGFFNRLNDEKYLARKYRLVFDKKLDYDRPKTFNEKLQWLKLFDRRPEYTVMVDKYLARDYIAKTVGEQYLIPLLGVWDSPDEIDFDRLPDKFVLKCNHNSGLGMCICKNKSSLNIRKTKRELRRGLKQNYYLTGREWPYKNVPRKIIAEQFMENGDRGLTDYKIHCFNGKPELILVCADRFTETGLTEDFFSPRWEHLDICRPNIPNSSEKIEKPEELGEMLELAEKLSKNIPFLRVDLYVIEHKIYFSELTFFPASGFEKFEPETMDETLGSLLKLPTPDGGSKPLL